MKTGKALLGVLTGLAAGTALGLIFSPRRGNGSQGKVSAKSKELADALTSRIDEKFEELQAKIASEK
jgi:gas vesicle protein